MLNISLLSVVGFFFWLVAARLYTPFEIGIATTLFSSVMLLSGLSSLGLNSGLLRFIPTSKKFEKKVNSSLLTVAVVSAILSLFYVIFLPVLSPSLAFLERNPMLVAAFIFFTTISACNDILESTLIALRHVAYVVIKNLFGSAARFTLLFSLIFLGGFGIFSSVFLGITSSMIVGFFLLYRKTKYSFRPEFMLNEVREMGVYSFGLFAAGQANNIPSYLLPVIITGKLSAQDTAYYFIAASVANFLYLVPKIVTTNLLVEGSYNEKRLYSHVRHSLFIIFAFYIPTAIIFLLFGSYLLQAFGKSYSDEGYALLKLMTLSGFFVCINYVLGTIVAIKKQISIIIFTNILSAFLMVVLSFFFLHLGIVGIGYATIITQVILSGIYLLVFRKASKLKKHDK